MKTYIEYLSSNGEIIQQMHIKESDLYLYGDRCLVINNNPGININNYKVEKGNIVQKPDYNIQYNTLVSSFSSTENIILSNIPGNTTLSIYSKSGKEIHVDNVEDGIIEFEDLPLGEYDIKLNNKNYNSLNTSIISITSIQ